MKLSLIVPCYNEAENVAEFQAAVISAFDCCGYDYEIVFVDDGSKDATLHNLRKLHAKQQCPVKVISFSRNFGKEAGLFVRHFDKKIEGVLVMCYVFLEDVKLRDLKQCKNCYEEFCRTCSVFFHNKILSVCYNKRQEYKR